MLLCFMDASVFVVFFSYQLAFVLESSSITSKNSQCRSLDTALCLYIFFFWQLYFYDEHLFLELDY